MGRVIKTILRAIFRPDKNGQLLESQLSSGLWTRTFIGLILFGLLFSLTSIFQAFSGNVPAIPLILPFSLENYFVWQAVLFIPWLVLSWLLVSWLTRVIFRLSGAKRLSLRQLSAAWLSVLSFPLLVVAVSFFTAVLYSLGMSQKEWVDLVSNPGWFQTVYLCLIIIALLSGWLATCLTLTARRWTKRGNSLLAGSLSYLAWILIIFILLR